MASQRHETNEPSNDDELKKRLAKIREKIDRGLEQLDESQGVSAQEARARLRKKSA
jgi:hypothetical protein